MLVFNGLIRIMMTQYVPLSIAAGFGLCWSNSEEKDYFKDMSIQVLLFICLGIVTFIGSFIEVKELKMKETKLLISNLYKELNYSE